MICTIKKYIFLEIISFIVKKAIKADTPLSAYEKNWIAFSAVKSNIVYYNKNWLLQTTTIICEKKKKQCQNDNKKSSENHINMNLQFILPHLYDL